MAEDRPDYDPLSPLRSLHDAMQREVYDAGRLTRDIREFEVAKERGAVEREQAMIRELKAMRAALQRGAQSEAEAIRRADDAEAREAAAQERSERREGFMVRLTVASVALSGVSAAATLIVTFG